MRELHLLQTMGNSWWKKTKTLSYTSPRRKVASDSRWAGCTEASRSHKEETGAGTKVAVPSGSSQKKTSISQTFIPVWSLLCPHGSNVLFWELGNPRLTVGDRNSCRGLVLGQSQEQGSCCQQPIICSLGRRLGCCQAGHETGKWQTHFKHCCVWHCSGRSMHTVMVS